MMIEKKINVIVTLQIEATHNWPKCPFKDVDFLRYPHRHIFHIKCKKEVTHTDRDVEIILLKRDIKSYLLKQYNGKFGSKSCEMIAEELCELFKLNYCSVLEDNENGAEVIINKKTDTIL
jgi:hypothetical protein